MRIMNSASECFPTNKNTKKGAPIQILIITSRNIFAGGALTVIGSVNLTGSHMYPSRQIRKSLGHVSGVDMNAVPNCGFSASENPRQALPKGCGDVNTVAELYDRVKELDAQGLMSKPLPDGMKRIHHRSRLQHRSSKPQGLDGPSSSQVDD
ncbi:hypothetical protein AUEXF2481DRAFT_32494 [Aureobasidium subglaciale EXF-2481]|uniref:Uncharacterized protein n=1 Tax=Aureobasidium subglaciale (strain EXF-2481) TaxID=1043005 RepID=A0A074YYU8_AURSE|nr:uncharacterized protein AUEXF2481DRAFT_32494 [Aureobasidium subglaciale EXF-2481]KEQ92011.1 hypothetical protein AUEXF2481DRAFT_32494 [Aureobasidium subglaciale EXF-2481]